MNKPAAIKVLPKPIKTREASQPLPGELAWRKARDDTREERARTHLGRMFGPKG